MWKHNCGILPIVDPYWGIIGVVTDRDMCIAAATRNRLPGDIAVSEIASGSTYSCNPDDDVRTALQTMAEKKVRRLLVINSENKLEGILSTDDIVLHADARSPRTSGLSVQELLGLLQDLYQAQLRPALAQKTR
jgi:CBS domain-containing protein